MVFSPLLSFSKVIRAWLNDELHNNNHGIALDQAWIWMEELLQREKSGDVNLGPAPDLFSAILKTSAQTVSRGEGVLKIG